MSLLKKITISILVILFFSIQANSQQNSTNIKGKLTDTTLHQSLKDASVSLLEAEDSTLEQFTLSKAEGIFELKRIKQGNYILQIVFSGYITYTKKLNISATSSSEINLGTIYMESVAANLKEVVVTQSPISIKKDTIEFNASSFKTKPNADAEDLLKKLPGVEVGSDGTVKAQGEQVKRVLVDGKRFFGDDPKMATKNLPPDVIDKIQVFDDLSDQSKFTGFDDGNHVKTINITTKKDKRKGYFGKAAIGAGDKENYDAMFNLHRFNADEQNSFLGQANDINKQNFSNQDILGTTGGGRGGRGGGGNNGTSNSGITTTWSGGANMRKDWGTKLNITGSYFYNQQHTYTQQNNATQNILTADSSTFNTGISSSMKQNKNHRINFNVEWKMDTLNTLIFRPNIAIQETTPISNGSTITTRDPKQVLTSTTQSNSSSINKGYSISGASLLLRHRFKKPMRTTSLDLNFSANENNGNGKYAADNQLYYPVNKDINLNQYYNDSYHSISFTPTISYTEPISKNAIIELNYNYSYNKHNSINSTYNYDSVFKTYNKFDSLFSNDYLYTSNSNRVTLNYRLQKNKMNFNIGSGIQFTHLNSFNSTKQVGIDRNFVNLTPTANFSYNKEIGKSFRAFYSGRTGQPGTSQLQPIASINGLDTTIGNPDLHPQFTHSLRLLYNSFDMLTQRVFFVTLNASAITNDIQNSITNYSKGSKKTTYVNLNGTYNVSAYVNYGFPLKNPKSNVNLTTNVSYNQNQNLVDGRSNFTYNTTIGETLSWTTNLKDKFDVNLKSTTTYNIAKYTLTPTQNFNYFVQVLSLEATYFTKTGWIFTSNFDYTFNGNRAAGYNANTPLLSPSIAKQFLKNNAGELKFSIFDLLNQNTSVSRNISNNTIQDIRTNTLTRYAMLTFTYNLRNFANKRDGKMPPFMRGAFKSMRQAGGNPRDF